MVQQFTDRDIIRYIYGKPYDIPRMDAFNKANQQILALLKKYEDVSIYTQQTESTNDTPIPIWNGKPLYTKDTKPRKVRDKQRPRPKNGLINPLAIHAFDYIVNKKLDYPEILSLKVGFKDAQDIKDKFAILKQGHFSKEIDNIYKKHGLDLPPFSTWKASDFNKGPGDRGELPNHPAHFKVNQDGTINKVRYDGHGAAKPTPLNEIRKFISNVLNDWINLQHEVRQ